MSEEEKKAIETLKEVASDNFDTLGDDISPKMAQNILNVLEKQQEENEELKENYNHLLEKYEMKKILYIRKDHNTKELLSELYIRKDTLDADYISKDKIREKIKELIVEKWEYTNYSLLNDIKPFEDKIDILNELLEE